MGRPRPARQITLTTLLVAITVALTVGWEILVVREFRALMDGFTIVHWLLLILGSLFFVAIITATILQTVWLVREIKTNQRQSDFIDAVTHELHTPLASLRLYVDTLAKPDLDEAHRFEFASIMSDDLERLQRTIDRVLDAARSESRRPTQARVDLVRVLDECVREARARHGLGPDRVRLLAPVRAAVRGDAEQLRLAFRNLIENAIRYAGERVDVDVRVRAGPGRRVEVEVADQGVGIPPSALARIFQRFQRLPQSAARGPRGLGLGLYIVRNVVKAHGGRVHAESEGPGTGSRFVVRLPGTLEEHAHPAG
jgi:signal transduction histidine kinase